MPTKGHMRDGGMSELCEDLHPSIYRRRGRQPPRGSTPQEVPPPLPSSCGWTLHSQKQRVTHYSHNFHNSPLKIPRVYHIKTLLILLFNVTQINEHFIQWVLHWWTLHSMNTLTIIPLHYFDIPKLFQQFYQNSPCVVQYFLRRSVSTQTRQRILKCVTLRFVNKMDMTETLLWSIIISGIWRSMMTPTYSTMN
jgi:hypothetical protein